MSQFRFPVYMDKDRYVLLQEKCRARNVSVSAFYRDVADFVIEDDTDTLFKMLRPYSGKPRRVSQKSPPLL